MCAGRSTFCLVKGTIPDHLGFALVTSRKPCPMNGVCVKEPTEPSNWPSHAPWPPLQSWPHNYKFPADYNFPDFWPFMWQPIPLLSYPPDQVPVKEAPGPSTKLTASSNENIPPNYLVNKNGNPLQNGDNEVQVSSTPNYGNSQQASIPVQSKGNYLLENNSNINVGNDPQNDPMQQNDVPLQNNQKSRNINNQQDFQVENNHSNATGINFNSSARKASTRKERKGISQTTETSKSVKNDSKKNNTEKIIESMKGKTNANVKILEKHLARSRKKEKLRGKHERFLINESTPVSVAFKSEDADQIFRITPLNKLEQKNALKERKEGKKTKAKSNKNFLKGGYAPTPVQYQDEDQKEIEIGSLKAPTDEMQPVQIQNQTQVHQQQQQRQRQQHLGDSWQIETPYTEPPQVDTPWVFSPPLFLSQSYPMQPQHMYQHQKPVDQYLLQKFKKPNPFYTLSKPKHHHHKRRDPSLFTWLAAKKFNGKQKVSFACKIHKTLLENFGCIF